MLLEHAGRRAREVADYLWSQQTTVGRRSGKTLIVQLSSDTHEIAGLLESIPSVLETAAAAIPPSEEAFWDQPNRGETPQEAAYRQGVREAIRIIEIDLGIAP